MSKLSIFHNFDILIRSNQNSVQTDSYLLSVQQSLAGETEKPVETQIDLSKLAIQEALSRLEYRDISREMLKDFGIQLKEWLLPSGPVWDIYQKSFSRAEVMGDRLRLRLRIEPSELSTLPWEYIYDESTEEFFALKHNTALVRYHNQPIAPVAMLRQTPISILIVMAEPEEINALPYSHSELVNLLQALKHLREQGHLQIDILYGGMSRPMIHREAQKQQGVRLLDGNLSIDMLGRVLHRSAYHVVHYIGHSQFDDEQGGVLVITDQDNKVAIVGAGRLALAMQGSSTSVVVLNACQSAEDGATRSYMGLAPRLIQTGIPAVVAMQYDIPDQAAMRFSSILYQSLADGQPLDAAVVAGRIALTSLTQDNFSMDWGIPALFMRSRDGLLWKTDTQSDDTQSDDIQTTLQQFSQQIKPSTHETQSAALVQGINRHLDYLKTESTQDSKGGPYRGLLTYRLGDSDIFFGRERDVDQLLNHLEFSHLTILHAESGAGKSSLLHAGLAPRLITQKHLPIHVRSYNLSPTQALKRLLVKNLEQEPTLLTESLRDFLYRICDILESETKLYIILDQFEEFFLLLDESVQSDFIQELADCLEDITLDVYWIISLRREHFGELANFQPRIAQPFTNQHHLKRMNQDQAYMVIDKPAARYGIHFEQGLIQRLIDDLNQASGDISQTKQEEKGVVPSQLQLVCLALYEELEIEQTVIDHDLYDKLGGVAGILQNHLENVLRRGLPHDQRRPARFLLEALITSQTRRVMRTRTELIAELGLHGFTDTTLSQIINQMVTQRLLRVTDSYEETEPVYELAHDYLIQEIELSEDVKKRKKAQELLESEVLTWRASETLISPERLRIIYKQHSLLYFDDLAAELLARSALEVGQDIEFWFKTASPDLRREVLLDNLTHEHTAVRASTITHLAPYFDADIELKLNQMATDDEHPEVHKAALTLLADHRSPFAQQIAFRSLHHSDPDIRHHAILILQKINAIDDLNIEHQEFTSNAAIQELLFTLAATDDEPVVWTQALVALNEQKIEPAENKLEPVSEDAGPIHYIRKIALSVVEKSPAEAYWSPLQKIPLARQSAIYREVVTNSTISLPRSTQFRLLLSHLFCLGWTQICSHPVSASFIILLIVALLFAGYNSLKNVRLESYWVPYTDHGSGSQKDQIRTVNVADDQTLMLGTYHYGPIWSNDDGWQTESRNQGFHIDRQAWNTDDTNANLPTIYAMAKSDAKLYALIEEGVYRYSTKVSMWVLLTLPDRAGMPTLPGRSECVSGRNISTCKPFAVYDKQLLLLAKNQPGIWFSVNSGDEWHQLENDTGMLDGDFASVLFDDRGRPYAGGRNGIYRGDEKYPWNWEVIDDEISVKNMAVGADNRLYLAIVDPAGGEIPKIGCYNIDDKNEFALHRAPVTNPLLTFILGVPIGIQAIEPHPENPNIFYLADNSGAIYKMNCDGEALQIGKNSRNFSSLAIWKQKSNLYLLWGNQSGLFRYKEDLMQESIQHH